MRNIGLTILLPILLAACGSKTDPQTTTLSGEIKGLGNDTLYVYSTDRFCNSLDTLVVVDDKFNVELTPDTLAATWLRFADGTRYPLYLDKGEKIQIKGTAADLAVLDITGNAANEELTDFLQQTLKGPAVPSDKMLEEKATAFIESHPTSPASVYLLEKYLIQKAHPDLELIKKLIEGMTGDLKDRPAISNVLASMEEKEKTAVGKVAPPFNVKDKEGKTITRSNFKDQYLLLHFWASWDDASRQANAVLRRIYLKEKKNKDFALWGISLDVDKTAWLEAIEKDTLDWKQDCDLAAWETDAVQKFAIQALPANVLLTPSGKILARNLDEAALEQQLGILKKEVKEKKEAEKKKK